MRYRNWLIGSISAFAGILLVILIAVNLIMVQESFLNYTNQKYSVHKNLSMSEDDLKKVVHSMISYVKGQADSPQVTVEIKGEDTDFFNKKELGHLADVQNLMKNIYITMVVLFLIFAAGESFLFRKKDKKAMLTGILGAWGILSVLAALIGILAIIDINIVIDGFHKLFLSDSKWVLNPALDRSVWMFRTKMYTDVLLILGAIVGVTGIVTVGGAVPGIRRITKK